MELNVIYLHFVHNMHLKVLQRKLNNAVKAEEEALDVEKKMIYPVTT